MHRNQLIKLLNEYKNSPFFLNKDSEINLINKITTFINNHKNCFERSLEIGHITGSALLLNKTEDKILLMLHKKLDKWVQFGGHADGDSNILNVAIKETIEESGIEDIKIIYPEIFDIDIHLIEKSIKIPHYHYDIRFLLKVANSENFVINKESKKLQWFTKEELENLELDPSVKKLANKWQLHLAKNRATASIS